MTNEQEFTVDGPVKVEVRLARGEIALTSGDVDIARVTLSGPERLLEATTVHYDGRTLAIRQREKGLKSLLGGGDLRAFFNESLDVEVIVPRDSSADLATAAGDVQLRGDFADVELKSASGDLEVRGNVSGDVSVKNVSGSVELQHVGGDLRIQTVSGDLLVGSVDGSVDATSVSGDVCLRSLCAGQVRVQNVSGDVELGIARGCGVDIDASSASGEMSSDLELSDSPCCEDGPVVVIRARTVSGDLHVSRAPERQALSIA